MTQETKVITPEESPTRPRAGVGQPPPILLNPTGSLQAITGLLQGISWLSLVFW